jgi:hypothetical protein
VFFKHKKQGCWARFSRQENLYNPYRPAQKSRGRTVIKFGRVFLRYWDVFQGIALLEIPVQLQKKFSMQTKDSLYSI